MIVVPVGTRAELIKMSSLLLALEKSSEAYTFINLNQHPLDEIISSLGLPEPHVTNPYNLREAWSRARAIGASRWFRSSAKIIGEQYVNTEDRVVILGHGNTLAMDLALGIHRSLRSRGSSVHIEAGVRAFFPVKPDVNNWRRARFADLMYRQGDRRADVNIAVMKSSLHNLSAEGFGGTYVQDPMVEIVSRTLKRRARVKKPKGRYMAANATRSIDSRKKALALLGALGRSGERVVYAVNPKIEARLRSYGIWNEFSATVDVREPMDYASFVHLMKGAQAVITDSNSTQEECAVLRKRCIVTNDFAQFPELARGVVRVTGCHEERLVNALSAVKPPKITIGDGHATERILEEIRRLAQ